MSVNDPYEDMILNLMHTVDHIEKLNKLLPDVWIDEKTTERIPSSWFSVIRNSSSVQKTWSIWVIQTPTIFSISGKSRKPISEKHLCCRNYAFGIHFKFWFPHLWLGENWNKNLDPFLVPSCLAKHAKALAFAPHFLKAYFIYLTYSNTTGNFPRVMKSLLELALHFLGFELEWVNEWWHVGHFACNFCDYSPYYCSR